MESSIYSYGDYKAYLHDRIRSEPRAGHGTRNRLAQAIGCQLAYVSHVLNGDRHFSVEQAEAATRFFALGVDETEFFIWLVEWARAGTRPAREFFSRLLDEKRAKYLQFKNRVAIESEVSDADKSMYYSSYLFAAVHMLVTIPEFRTADAIARRLNQPLPRIVEIVDFLRSRGFIRENRGRLEPGSKYVFIDRTSPFVLQHHSNWRIHSLQSIARREPRDLHLSLTVTLSEKDADLLRQRMAQFVEEISVKIKDSKEERLMNLNLDFFDV